MSNWKEPEGFLTGQEAVDAIEAQLERPLSIPERIVLEEEGYTPIPYKDLKGIPTVGVGQTGKWMNKSYPEAFAAHEEDVRRIIDDYDELPPEVQGQIMSAAYRGDLKPNYNWVKLFNEGKYGQAAIEFLDHEEYKNEVQKPYEEQSGVPRRMERIYNELRMYDPTMMEDLLTPTL